MISIQPLKSVLSALHCHSGNPWVTPAEDPNDAARPNWCTFKGVTCFTDGCKKKAYVSAISLAGLSLAGSLPSEIGHFSKLTSFDMKGNRLTKKIPSSIGMLSSITSLSLAGNAITGTVPDVLTKMTSLVSLDLSSNRFNGDPFPATLSELRLLPAFINTLPSSIGLLSSLTYLNISNSLLIGSIPTSVSNLKNLVAFSLSKNSLTGTIPDSISDLTNLQALDLSSNSFEGVFPPRLKQLTRLTSIKVTNNFLTSAREDFRLTFANMPQIPVGDIIESYCNNCYLVFVAGSITYCNIRNGCLLPGKPTFAPTILGELRDHCRLHITTILPSSLPRHPPLYLSSFPLSRA